MIDPHFQQVFSMALGIREPWFIKSLEMVPSSKNPEKLEMRIEIDFTEGTKFQYGDSGTVTLYTIRGRGLGGT